MEILQSYTEWAIDLISDHMRKIAANERKYNNRDVFSHWPSPCSQGLKKYIQNSPWSAHNLPHLGDCRGIECADVPAKPHIRPTNSCSTWNRWSLPRIYVEKLQDLTCFKKFTTKKHYNCWKLYVTGCKHLRDPMLETRHNSFAREATM